MEDFVKDISNSGDQQVKIDELGEDNINTNQIVSDLNVKLSEDLKLAEPEDTPNLEVTLVEGKISISINDKPITVVGIDGKTYQFADAITDPNVKIEDTINSLSNSLNEVGIDITSYKDNITNNLKANPTRVSNIESNNIEIGKSKAIPISSDVGFIDTQGSKLTDADLNSKCKDLNNQIKELNSKLKDMTPAEKQSTWDKAKDAMRTLGQLAGIAALGYLTYELLKKHADAMSGCIEYTQDASNNTNKCKTIPLTCDSDSATNNSYNTNCDVPTPACNLIDKTCPNNPYACQLIASDPPLANCNQCADTIDSRICSKFCSNLYLKTVDGSTKINYTCVNASISDAIADIFNGVTNVIGQAASGANSLISNIWKYGKYFIYAILIIIALVILYKVIQSFWMAKEVIRSG